MPFRAPRTKVKREPRTKARKRRWHVLLHVEDKDGNVSQHQRYPVAYTRSEARAQVKQEFGLRRLPVDAQIFPGRYIGA